jgi:hypothetical protein
MKNKISYFLLALSVIILSNCKDDPCDGKICLNGGTCVDGTCQCTGHFEGSTCADETVPSKVIITKIVVTQFPATESGGGGWDVSSGPDLIAAISINNNADYIGDTYFEDAAQGSSYTFTPLTQLELSPLTVYPLALLDYDDTVDDVIAAFNFKPYEAGEKFPAQIPLTGNGVTMTVFVTYKF